MAEGAAAKSSCTGLPDGFHKAQQPGNRRQSVMRRSSSGAAHGRTEVHASLQGQAEILERREALLQGHDALESHLPENRVGPWL
jgi:ribosomal protein S12 methylthiotransferase accessory factor YcaO